MTTPSPLDLADQETKKRNAKLKRAIKNNSPEGVRRAVALGSNPNASFKQGETPLHLACGQADQPVVEALLRAGADPTLLNERGQTVIHYAALYGKPHLIDLLALAGAPLHARSADNRTLMHYAAAGSRDTVRHVAGLGFDLNAVSRDWNTPLTSTVWGERDCMAALLELGADVHLAPGPTADSPLHRAAHHDSHYAHDRPMRDTHTALLLQHGADPNARNTNGDTPLFEACRTFIPNTGITPAMRVLLEAGADLAARNWNGTTVLDVVCDISGKESVALLLAAALKHQSALPAAEQAGSHAPSL